MLNNVGERTPPWGTQDMKLTLFAFRDLWKEWGDSNLQIFSQNCQFHHRRLDSLEHFKLAFCITLSIMVSFSDLKDAICLLNVWFLYVV